ncbi:outer membrane protein OmpA-like peptidoglycan-associated protein [Desulfobaculum xiamenense]|uniref:Outer membrane protein OmpA-like peptidoglycan-associated protein n=1 Tax=Desulfobaculum xiamenense TaxID=995050 RepID=A0A846QPB9_9BACT|nr:OmpA family protein [Desulfobaculum xiamenense]NJB68332.1 outer membrane protein OmpA-like peptidoglycan-associated protein [Desulfobaculum xiamenense]
MRIHHLALAILLVGFSYGCQPKGPDVQPHIANTPRVATAPTTPIRKLQVDTLPLTAQREWQDRVNRLERLVAMLKIGNKPEVSSFQVEPGVIDGINHATPVIRIRFDSAVFFAFDSDKPRKDCEGILELMSEMMKRDMPDTQLLLLGHTDSRGTQGYNMALSLRRATNVMKALLTRGVRTRQMSTVAIGEMQPVASNKTTEGRARNRRVEFLLSSSLQANLNVVSEVDFCATCIEEQDHGSVTIREKSTSIAEDESRKGINDLQVMQLTDEHRIAPLEGTLETAKHKSVQTYLTNHKSIEVY